MISLGCDPIAKTMLLTACKGETKRCRQFRLNHHLEYLQLQFRTAIRRTVLSARLSKFPLCASVRMHIPPYIHFRSSLHLKLRMWLRAVAWNTTHVHKYTHLVQEVPITISHYRRKVCGKLPLTTIRGQQWDIDFNFNNGRKWDELSYIRALILR